jgi:galactokinase/mevalonate kinase-like predicted kinase
MVVQRFTKMSLGAAMLALALAGASQAQVAAPLNDARARASSRVATAQPYLVCRAVYVRGWTENGVNRMSRENTSCDAPTGAAIGQECTCARRLSSGATEVATGRVARRPELARSAPLVEREDLPRAK